MSSTDLIMGSAGGSGGSLTDPNFKNVSLLLSGDGTNGAQNNTFIDSSSNNFSLTRNGNLTQGSFSPYGNLWSNYFDGSASNARLQFPSGNMLPASSNFTLEFWFNPTYTGGSGTITSQGTLPYSDNGRTGTFINSDGTIGTGIGESFPMSSSPATAVFGQWNHYAWVRNGSTYTMYLNGVQVAQATNSSKTIDSGYFRIGTLWDGDGGGLVPYKGHVSNLRITYAVVYTSNFTPSVTPLTAISGTQLLTCQSNRFIDNSSNNYSISINGVPKVTNFSAFNPTSAYDPTTTTGSGYFSDSSYLNFGNYAQVGSSDFTFETWFYPVPGGPYGGGGNMICIGGDNNGYFGFAVSMAGWGLGCSFSSGSGWYSVPVTFSIVYNQWYHVAVTRSSGNIVVYVNGQSVGTGSFSNSKTGSENYIGFYTNHSSNYDSSYSYMAGMRLVIGSVVYTGNFTPPTTPPTVITNTALLPKFANAGIADLATQNDWITNGGTQVSTSVKKFGTGSLYMNSGSLQCFPLKNASGIATFSGDFTWEYWFYPTNGSNNFQGGGLSYRDSGFGSGGFQSIYDGTTNTLKYIFDGGGTEISGNGITNNAWNHIALVRQGGTLSFYVNGNRKNTAAYSNVITGGGSSTLGFFIGDTYDGNHYYVQGYLDDIRITNGVARYSGTTFTPPALTLPNQ